jgi:hypothetical protein
MLVAAWQYILVRVLIGQHLNAAPMLASQMKQRPRWRRPSNEVALVTAYSLWIVSYARIHLIYNNTKVTVESLWTE